MKKYKLKYTVLKAKKLKEKEKLFLLKQNLKDGPIILLVANGQTTSLDMVSSGQVIVQDIKWIKDTDGLYKIVVIDVD